ncbi:MAG: ribosome-associated protein [Pseudohongiellaceae bacterium]|jgi:ribosome-associated protein
MAINKQLQQLNNQLDKCKRKLAAAEKRRDQAIILQAQAELEKLTKSIAGTKAEKNKQVNQQAEGVKTLAFNRELTKQEQADMGKLKKSVRGLIVVHPLTSMGRELGVAVVTGYAPKPF